jgi:nucleotide-binding universal stress UspA family protein
MKNILVAIDLTKDDEIIIAKAEELALKYESKLWLIHIAAPDPDFVGLQIGPQYIRDHRALELKEEHQKIQSYISSSNGKGINTEGLLIQGATVEMIVQESLKLEIDLIVLGHHKHNFLYKTFFGSSADLVIKKSKVPLLIVPV